MTRVSIRQKSNHNVIEEYKIISNFTAIEEFYDEAWKNAVDDNLVDELKRSDYLFEII
jgi:hypothetical protein